MNDRSDALAAHLRRASRKPFDWYGLNCWFFVADWVAIARGIDPAAEMRGRFRSRIECLRTLRDAGFADPGHAAAALLARAGLEEIDPAHACLGDVGSGDGLPSGKSIGAICSGSYWAAKIGAGLWMGRAKITRAWRV